MMFARALVISAALCSLCQAAVRSGKATAEWISASTTWQPGKPVRTAIRLTADDGWHTYWQNPGDAGMKTSIKLDLPQGWTAGEPGQPVPERFMTGELAGFGYKGSVLFLITLTPPMGAEGAVKPTAKVSWLACNDDACVPGDATITLELDAGAPSPTPEAAAIEAAERLVPMVDRKFTLAVDEAGGILKFTLRLPAGNPMNAAACEVFPATPRVVDPKAEIHFVKQADGWTAEAPKSEYATSPVRELALVFAGKGTSQPLQVTWTATRSP